MSDIAKKIKRCQQVGTPLVAVNTHDPAATIAAICAVVGDAAPLVEWDFIRGLTGRNDVGRDWSKSLGEDDPTIASPHNALIVAHKLPELSVLFVHLAQRWFPDSGFVQAAWNLRDSFKRDQRMVVFLGKSITLPAELCDDVMTFDEPLPTAEELATIVDQQHKNAKLQPIAEQASKAVEALRGLSAFAAEQVIAMSLTKSGVNIDSLWDRKRQQIEQTPGLKVFRGGDSFEQIGGCDIVKGFLSRIMAGHARPNAIVFIDEIEKMIGGQGDTSGVSQDQLGSLLSYMQDHSAAGMIFVGPPGAAKSAVAKSAGNAGGVPTIQLDLGGLKGSLVGQSEGQLRDALKVVTAVSNGCSLWIATCNAITSLPPELRRRFTLGTYFFDLPTAEERAMIWTIWLERYGLTDSRGFLLEKPNGKKSQSVRPVLPPAENWTGAEIKQCCDIAWRLGCPLLEAAAFVVPVAKSAPDKLNALREQANGRFLSASYPGVYLIDQKPKPAPKKSGERNIQLAE